MPRSTPLRDEDAATVTDLSGDPLPQPARLTVPLGVIGFLLLVSVMLAAAFYVAAQVVQTP